MEQLILKAEGKDSTELLDLLVKAEEVSWKDIIYGLVREEQMDPWNLDVSIMTKKYIDMVKQLKEFDIRVGGKVVLASAVLVKIKSDRLLEDDINALDSIIASAEESEDLYEVFDDDLLGMVGEFHDAREQLDDQPKIYPRTPQPRHRRVSVYDLVNALEKALEVQRRRKPRQLPHAVVKIPDKPRDMSLMMGDVFDKVLGKKDGNDEKLTFDILISDVEMRDEKVLTFGTLLHLRNAARVDLHQDDHFGEIEIELVSSEPLPAEEQSEEVAEQEE